MAVMLCDDSVERQAFDDDDPEKDKKKKNHDADTSEVDEEGYSWCDASCCTFDDDGFANVEL